MRTSDLKVFLNLEKETQRERIKARETAAKQERFFNEWIPMEERYFAKFSIKGKGGFTNQRKVEDSYMQHELGLKASALSNSVMF